MAVVCVVVADLKCRYLIVLVMGALEYISTCDAPTTTPTTTTRGAP